MGRRKSECRGKQPFKSKGAADAAIRSLVRREDIPVYDPDSLHAYPCPWCAKWHFGHQIQRNAKVQV